MGLGFGAAGLGFRISGEGLRLRVTRAVVRLTDELKGLAYVSISFTLRVGPPGLRIIVRAGCGSTLRQGQDTLSIKEESWLGSRSINLS